MLTGQSASDSRAILNWKQSETGRAFGESIVQLDLGLAAVSHLFIAAVGDWDLARLSQMTFNTVILKWSDKLEKQLGFSGKEGIALLYRQL